MDKISIIVPVYNVEKYLDECIQSIRNQTFLNLEILLIDDGSTDNSRKICDDYAVKDNRIKVIHKENGGLSDARNVGLENASGDYIGFVDSDDYIDEDMYELLYDNIIDSKADVSMCKARLVTDNRVVDDSFCEKNKEVYNTKEEMLKALYLGKGASIAVCLKLYKKHVFDNIRFIKGKTSEDAFVSWPIINNTNRMVSQNITKYNYRQREDSITHKKKYNDNILDVVEAYKYSYNCIKNDNSELLSIAECRLWWGYRTALGRIYETEDSNAHKEIIENIRKMIFHDMIKMLKNPYMSAYQLMIVMIIYFCPQFYRFLYKRHTGR